MRAPPVATPLADPDPRIGRQGDGAIGVADRRVGQNVMHLAGTVLGDPCLRQGLPCVREVEDTDYAAGRRAAGWLVAGDDFNRGIRAYYFGLAASGWLLNSMALSLLSIVVLVVLFRRDYRSPALHILRDPA